MEDYYEYLDSNGVTTLYKLIKDDTVALIDSYSVTINGITTTLDNHVNNADIHTPISTIEGMIDTAVGSLNYATPDYVDIKVAGLVNSAPETLDTLKELSDALGNDPNFATTVANQIGSKASKDDVYTKEEADTLLESKANSEHSHVVSDITDFPTIPTKVSDLTNDSGYITSVSWEDVTSKPELSQVAISGSYSDLSDTPTIPTKTSQLINDSGFLTSSNGLITSVSWSDITNKPNFSTVATSGSYNDLSNKPTIPKVHNKTLTIQKNGTNVATFTSNSNTDVTADITVPTKVSELSNDSGFITGISWDKVTNKPTLATVATSGSYTDLSNTPAIPTKVSQLENDMGFGTGGDTSDCVHKTGNETISGEKTFTHSPFVSNYAVTNGYFTKLNDVARNEVPSQIYHSAFRVFDKNDKTLGECCVEKSTSGSSLLHMDVHTEDSEGNDIMESVYLNLSNDGSTVSFHPAKNNRIDLGMSHYKWSKVYSDDVVHTTGNETINGVKTFTQNVNIKNNNSDLTVTPTNNVLSAITFRDKNNKTTAALQNSQRTYGVNDICFYVYDNSSNSHGFRIRTDKTLEPIENNTYSLGSPNNKWTKVYSDDIVHTSGDEIIHGTKIFYNTICRHSDLTTSTVEQVYNFYDTNANSCGHIYNNVHWHANAVYNRHGAYNAKSGKSMEIDITSNDSGVGMIYASGTATKGNLETVTSATGHTGIATMGWVNNPATSTNVVHRSGNETIAGNKTFSNRVSFPSGYYITTDINDNSLRIIRDGTGHGNNYKVIIQGDTGKIFAPNGFIGNLQGNADTATSANDPNAVHKTGNETIKGVKYFDSLVYLHNNMSNKNSQMDLFTTPANTLYSHYMFVDKNNEVSAYMQYGQQNTGTDFIGLFIHDKNRALHGLQVTSNNSVIPLTNNAYSLGGSANKWKNVYANTFNGDSVICTNGNAFMAQNGGYTFLIRNDGSNTYFLMSDKDGVPGTWSTARPLMISNATGICSINGNANTATYATTQATSDNSTKIATTAWVRAYVNSVGGSGNNTIGSSVSAYWSNMPYVTAVKTVSEVSSNGIYPACYTDFINLTPVVGTIYSGAQLYTVLNASASAQGEKKPQGQYIKCTSTVTAHATFSNPINSAGKYLCTTANTVRFAAYGKGSDSGGSASVIDNTSTKSIFIRVE